MHITMTTPNRGRTFEQASAWLNDLRLLEQLDLFESREERKEFQKMLAQAKRECSQALDALEPVRHRNHPPPPFH